MTSSPSKTPAAAALSGLPIEVRVCVGTAHPRLSELTALGAEAVLPLDSRVSDPVSLFVTDQLIAKGELVELDAGEGGGLAVRITKVAGLGESFD